MPIVRVTSTRPNTEVQFFSYSFDHFALMQSRYNFESHVVSTQDGLTRIVEMTFTSIERLNNWENDPDRAMVSNLVRDYNRQNGITVKVEVLT